MKALPPANGFASQPQEEERRNINSELWHACAGPLVSLPSVGSLVVYFPQGHSEQVAATMQKETDTQIPNYPNLPSMLVCQLHNVTLHADGETDEVYAQMTLQPVNTYNKDAILTSETGVKPSKHPTDFFCKTLTASDTSTHGGFSVPRRSAETIFPPLDYSQSPPAQEIVARDLHDNVWTFRHIYRGQPKRHLLTTGWSVFVSAKRLFAGDSVLFIRDEKQQLLLGIRRANRQQPAVTSSVLSSDSMHIGVLAAAAHAASSQSPFTVFYNPRASPSEFVIPFSKYHKAMCGIQVSLGMRFRMMFETEESGVRRYMGTVTGISDLDPVRWPNSQWRNIQVGWDESSAGEKRKRVSIWEIEPIATPFFLCPPPFFRPKRPRFPGILGDESELESVLKRSLPWYGDDLGITNLQASTMPGLLQWMNMQPRQDALNQPIQPDYGRPMTTAFQNTMASKMPNSELSKTLNALQQTLPPISGQFNIPLSQQSTQLQQAQLSWQQQQQQHQPVTVQQQNPLQQVDQNHLLPQPRLLSTQVEQQLQSQKASQQLQPSLAQQLHSPTQQLHQKISQPQTQTQLQSQLQRTQHHHQRFQQLPKSTNPFQQQPSLQVEHNLQRVQQEPQQQPSSIQTPQQFHPYQNQIVGSSGEQVQHPFQMPEIRDQLLQPTGSRTMAAGNVMPQSKAQCAFTETDALSCSTSSGNSYSLQNILSRATNSVLMPDEKCQNPNIAKANSESLHVPHPVSNVTEEHINSLLPPIKETNHASMHPYLGTQPTQMEAPSTSGSSFALAQSDANISQSTPLLNQQSSAVMLRDSSPNADTLAAPQRNSFSTGKDIPSLPSFSTGKDIQPQLCAPIASQAFGVPEIPLSSGVSGEDGIMEEAMLQTTSSWQQPTPPVRTYTKVRKLGAVGRSIDVTRCKNYDELRRELARLFGLEGQLEDPQTSGWQLVFVDNENDVLLVGDDPWEEFVSCVRCIRILSPSEVLQMSQEGLELLNNLPLQQQACSSSDGGILWRDHGDQNSNNPSAGSFDH